MPTISDLVRVLINKISNRAPPGLIYGSRIFLIAACESVKSVTVVGLLFLVFLMPSTTASEIAHSSASNESLLFPRKRCFSCQDPIEQIPLSRFHRGNSIKQISSSGSCCSCRSCRSRRSRCSCRSCRSCRSRCSCHSRRSCRGRQDRRGCHGH